MKNNVFSFLNEEEILLKIDKKSEVGFWNYQLLGFLSLFIGRDIDSLIITEKRIVYIIKSKIIKNIEYKEFSKIQFDSLKETISFIGIDNINKIIYLKEFRLSYEEIQKIKKFLIKRN